MKRTLLAVALLAAAGCTDQYGQIDPIRTGLLGAVAGGGAGLLGGAIARDQQPPPYYPPPPPYGYGYGHRYRPY